MSIDWSAHRAKRKVQVEAETSEFHRMVRWCLAAGLEVLSLPCGYRCGDPWKVAVMAARYHLGLPLMVDGDGPVEA